MFLSDVCLTSAGYIGPKSRTERPWKTKIGTDIAHVTCDLDTTFRVKRSRSPGCFTHCGLKAGAAVTVRTYWARGNYCYVASARQHARHWGPTGEERGILCCHAYS